MTNNNIVQNIIDNINQNNIKEYINDFVNKNEYIEMSDDSHLQNNIDYIVSQYIKKNYLENKINLLYKDDLIDKLENRLHSIIYNYLNHSNKFDKLVFFNKNMLIATFYINKNKYTDINTFLKHHKNINKKHLIDLYQAYHSLR